MATPHISAEVGQIAPNVIFPGDPARAQRIAQMLMPDAELVSEVRRNPVYTGTVNGTPLSVMASGMGVPSLMIYATELYRFYGVQRIIRVGTCGAWGDTLNVGDVVVGQSAVTDSKVAELLFLGSQYLSLQALSCCAVRSIIVREWRSRALVTRSVLNQCFPRIISISVQMSSVLGLQILVCTRWRWNFWFVCHRYARRWASNDGAHRLRSF